MKSKSVNDTSYDAGIYKSITSLFYQPTAQNFILYNHSLE